MVSSGVFSLLSFLMLCVTKRFSSLVTHRSSIKLSEWEDVGTGTCLCTQVCTNISVGIVSSLFFLSDCFRGKKDSKSFHSKQIIIRSNSYFHGSFSNRWSKNDWFKLTRVSHQEVAGLFHLLKGILLMTNYVKCFHLFDHSLVTWYLSLWILSCLWQRKNKMTVCGKTRHVLFLLLHVHCVCPVVNVCQTLTVMLTCQHGVFFLILQPVVWGCTS